MSTYLEREWRRFREYDMLLLDCPCGTICLTWSERHKHHEETGHEALDWCEERISKLGKRCRRWKGHNGLHAYPGYSYVVTWQAKSLTGAKVLNRKSVR